MLSPNTFITHIYKCTLKTSHAHATHANDANYLVEDTAIFQQETL
jgi:hypothetical protein